jgi:hypothetical protein
VVFKNLLSPGITVIYSIKLFSILIFASLISLFIPFDFNIFIKILLGLIITAAAGLYLKNRELPKLLAGM